LRHEGHEGTRRKHGQQWYILASSHTGRIFAEHAHLKGLCSTRFHPVFRRATSCPSCLKGTLVPLAARGVI
jgi:hypothetical protein